MYRKAIEIYILFYFILFYKRVNEIHPPRQLYKYLLHGPND